jgi:short-subunit dehydrogenase
MTRKTTLITGAGSGIGRARALDADLRGYELILVGRNQDKLAETKHRIGRDSIRIVPADVTEAVGRDAIRDAVDEELDVLINNAGTLAVGRLTALGDEDLEGLTATNLTAPIALTRDLVPALRRRGGRVVNIGSVFGDIAFPYFAAYSATKFGLRGFSDALRRELEKDGIGVTYVAPRAARTNAVSAFDRLIEPMQMTLDRPETVATRAWDAIEAGKREALPKSKERFFIWLQRLLPSLVDEALTRLARDPAVQMALQPVRRA